MLAKIRKVFTTVAVGFRMHGSVAFLLAELQADDGRMMSSVSLGHSAEVDMPSRLSPID